METHSAESDYPRGDAFRLLGHRYRRYAVEVLDEHARELALADLADEVARKEYEEPVPEIPSDDVSDLYLSLYHSHVPKLEDGDAVRYDRERDVVAPRDRIESLSEVLAAVE